ncbi:F-box/kelch-repeat protein OR23-like [Wolffia australiana]
MEGGLIPGLPDDIAAIILASLPISQLWRLRSTSRSWRSALSAPIGLLSSLRRPRDLLCVFPQDPSLAPPYLFDPSTLAWLPLPTIPCSPHSYGLSNFVPIAVGTRLYVVGGSHFDARAYPVDRPVPCAAAYRLDLAAGSPRAWTRLGDLICPRGSFAAVGFGDQIFVAGGGSRHAMFPSDGSRLNSVERLDCRTGRWRTVAAMPRERAGCVGWVSEGETEEELWVAGGYGEYRTVGGVFRADIYCRDVMVMGLRSGRWREIGEMWEEGERRKLGPVAVVEGENGAVPVVFMLDQNGIFRFIVDQNRWVIESTLRRSITDGESCGFVALDGELYVLTPMRQAFDPTDLRRMPNKKVSLDIQIYNPMTKIWKLLSASTPFYSAINFNMAALCTIQI